MKDQILEYITKEIKKSDDNLNVELEERGLSSNATYEDLGLDLDGIPRSQGNSDDVYNDGFRYGSDQGHYDCLIELKKYIESLK